MHVKKKYLALIVAVISTTGLSACSNGEDATKAQAIVITEPVARSIDSASYKSDESGLYMTGSFMTITNNGEEDVTLVGGSSEDAGRIEIHEVINGAMQPMSGGLKIPAGEAVKLRMGGYHVMLMDLNNEIKAGDEVTVTLEFDDGTSVQYTAPVKDIAMDDEVYGAEMGMNDDGAMK